MVFHMKKKQLISILLLIALLASLSACGKKGGSTTISVPVGQTTPPKQTTPAPPTQAPATATPTPKPTATPEPTPEPAPAVEVEWQTLTYQWEDSSGYTFEATLKVSPWINTKNTEYVTAAWNEVSNGKALPSDSSKSWGNELSGDGNYRVVENVTDVYYCIGNVKIKNLTTGWDITASAPVTSNSLWFSACQPEIDPAAKESRNKLSNENHERSSTISKIFYSDGETRNSTWACLNPKYTSNNWGPVPFVFSHFESKAPAYPDGKYISEITDAYFYVNTNNNWIWLKEMSELTMAKLSVIE